MLAVSAALWGFLPHVAAADGLAVVPGAVLAPVAPGVVVRPYERSGLRLASRLTNDYGRPVAGATVQVLQRVAGEACWEVVGSAMTSIDGGFVAIVPPGP
ncbi:MAG TPA: hypothetical protein VFJ24_01045 [Gaiellales bacterium]|nr:hypothetical protein [Gaiellales bacterium]